ncbi:MAG: PilZ domain-containing protein [Kineosporiaceae bacterium]|jgi:c-di-GMP-binding flagellar brake protein YcgR
MPDAVREQLRGEVFPQLNQLIRITVGRSADPDDDPVAADIPSRVEDVSVVPGQGRRAPSRRILHVAVPSYAGNVELLRDGTWCGVAWLTPTGVFELPTAFEGRDMVGPVVKAWRLVVTGPTVRAQRRRFVRVPWTAPVRVGCADGRVLDGQCIDLSEGGIRCLLPRPPIEAGDEVEVTLNGADGPMRLPAAVHRAQVVTTPSGKQVETVLVFTDPEPQADTLRRLVFEEQLRARRAGLA